MANHTPEALISSISGDYYLGNDAELELAKNIVSQLAAVTAQRDELQARLDTELANGWQSKWYKAIQCGAAVERQRDTLRDQRDELLSALIVSREYVYSQSQGVNRLARMQDQALIDSAIAKCEVQNG